MTVRLHDYVFQAPIEVKIGGRAFSLKVSPSGSAGALMRP